MAYPAQIQPELFALAGVFIFLALSLLTYFGEDRFPSKLPYIYQVAASFGLLFLVVGRFVLPELEETTRLWYCYGYLVVVLVNTVGANIYLAMPKREHKMSRRWSVAIAFPSILISAYFVAQYNLTRTSLGSSIAEITVMSSCAAIATGVGILAFRRISHASLHRVHKGR